MSDPRSRTLVTADDLAALLAKGGRVVLLDVRDEPTPARKMIPGAFATTLAEDFCSPTSKQGGKRPLPRIASLQENVKRWGVHPDTPVVVYDDNAGAQASRAWWTLRWGGVANVRILDGGVDAWIAAGRPTTSESAPPPNDGTIALCHGCMPTLDADDAAAFARESHLLDARGRAAYLGGPVEPGKPPTGHIPGAACAPSGDHVAAGAFKSGEDICARLAELGVDCSKPIGVYCGSGNAASHLIAAMHAAGLEAALYVGSWSAWSADPARPVATGPEPG